MQLNYLFMKITEGFVIILNIIFFVAVLVPMIIEL